MRKKVYVEVPERPDVEAFVFIDRPGIIYMNRSCKKEGVGKIIPERPLTPDNDQQGKNA